jgi:hypothetical protein
MSSTEMTYCDETCVEGGFGRPANVAPIDTGDRQSNEEMGDSGGDSAGVRINTREDAVASRILAACRSVVPGVIVCTAS